MMKAIKSKKGFTLVELVLVLALISVVMLPLSSFFIGNYKYLHKAERQIRAEKQAEKALNAVSSALLNARAAVDRSFIDGNAALGVERIVFELLDGSYEVLEYVDSDEDGIQDSICIKNSGDINEHIDGAEISDTQKAEDIAYFNIALKPDNEDLTKSNMAVITVTAAYNDKLRTEGGINVTTEIYMRNSIR